MTNLLPNKTYIYNSVTYQDRDGYVNACGPHVVHRLYRLKNDGMDRQTYYNYMKHIKDEFGYNRVRVRQQVVLINCCSLLICTCCAFTMFAQLLYCFFVRRM
ncbi:MAG: hypothetical protein ACKPKO_42115 [Candidatus Fonsibacter sp.]